MTSRNDFIAATAARLMDETTFPLNAIRDARGLADELEKQGCAPWTTSSTDIERERCALIVREASANVSLGNDEARGVIGEALRAIRTGRDAP